MTTWPRRVLPTAVCLLALTGCTAPIAGVTGVTVTAEGEPLGVLLVCHDGIDAAVLYPADPPPADPSAEEAEDAKEPEYTDSWTAEEAVTDYTTWPLTGPAGGGGLTPDAPPHALKPGQLYTVYGAAQDNSWSTDAHSFTLADLTKLRPDQVAYTYDDEVRTTTVADFRAHACEE
ncbi:hypothetical protein [Streptomyces sp. NPDC057494]|uniref:hypothetical protein n=1 Tax=Streptomyces sp. NPDC057494 TaxID=3346148 RepID=UPI0036AB8686